MSAWTKRVCNKNEPPDYDAILCSSTWSALWTNSCKQVGLVFHYIFSARNMKLKFKSTAHILLS